MKHTDRRPRMLAVCRPGIWDVFLFVTFQIRFQESLDTIWRHTPFGRVLRYRGEKWVMGWQVCESEGITNTHTHTHAHAHAHTHKFTHTHTQDLYIEVHGWWEARHINFQHITSSHTYLRISIEAPYFTQGCGILYFRGIRTRRQGLMRNERTRSAIYIYMYTYICIYMHI
jgi:hypothetical protein